MNNTLRNILVVLAVLVLAGAIFFAGGAAARSSNFGFWGMMNGRGSNYVPEGITNGLGNNAGLGGMMNGRGNNGTPGDIVNGQPGNAGLGGIMMGGFNNTNAAPLGIDQAKTAAEAYVKNLGVQGLVVNEIMVFDNNAYAVVKETGTGRGALELLIDSGSQYAYPEHGPNIMWNQKYGGLNHQNMTLAPGANAGMGRHGGMMGVNGWNTTTPAQVPDDMTVSPEQAIQNAQKYLDVNLPGATAATDPVKFYGYYTLDFEKDGKVVGMLSVNGYSGEIFLHTWHGTFIEESKMP